MIKDISAFESPFLQLLTRPFDQTITLNHDYSILLQTMSSAAVSNPATQQPSKSSRKKKGKTEAPAQASTTPAETETGGETANTEGATTNGGDYESPYLKDLSKSVDSSLNDCLIVEKHALAHAGNSRKRQSQLVSKSHALTDCIIGAYAASRRNS